MLDSNAILCMWKKAADIDFVVRCTFGAVYGMHCMWAAQQTEKCEKDCVCDAANAQTLS